MGKSLTRGLSDCVTWAGIHHKTMVEGGLYGFPDPGYLPRVLQELNERGITDQDMETTKPITPNFDTRIENTSHGIGKLFGGVPCRMSP